MAERTNHIDFAQAVLRKYPDAYAWQCVGGWQIWGNHTGKTPRPALSDIKTERDEAWLDAYRRIYKITPTSE